MDVIKTDIFDQQVVPEDMIAEVKTLEPSLLGEKDDHDTARPVESLAKQLLHSELIFSN